MFWFYIPVIGLEIIWSVNLKNIHISACAVVSLFYVEYNTLYLFIIKSYVKYKTYTIQYNICEVLRWNKTNQKCREDVVSRWDLNEPGKSLERRSGLSESCSNC